MTPTEILEELKRLPTAERLEILEAALRLTREEIQAESPKTAPAEKQRQMAVARERLLHSLNEKDEESGFLQKIFRVFTG